MIASPRSKHLVVVGDLVLDVVAPVTLPVQAGRHQHTDLLRAGSGGTGGNVMIAARRLGLDVSAVGAVGDDPFGAQILGGLRAEDIDTRGVTAPPGSTSNLVIVITDPSSGEHVFIGHRGSGAAIDPTETTRGLIASADAVFVDGFALADQRTQALAFTSMAQANESGIPVYFDPGPMLPRAQPDIAQRGAAACDVLLLTADEASLLVGRSTHYVLLLNWRTWLIVVKAGQAGCTIITETDHYPMNGFSTAVVDTVGAGDCFDAAFIAARLNGWNDADAARLANAAGAASAQKIGAGTHAPTCAEIDAVLIAAGLSLRSLCEG